MSILCRAGDGGVAPALDVRAEHGQERERLGLGEHDFDHTGTAFVSKTFGTRGCAKVCWKASRAWVPVRLLTVAASMPSGPKTITACVTVTSSKSQTTLPPLPGTMRVSISRFMVNLLGETDAQTAEARRSGPMGCVCAWRVLAGMLRRGGCAGR